MRLRGAYENPYTRTPEHIHASGTPDEFRRILPHVDSTFPIGRRDGEDTDQWHAELPPDRDVVKRIAKAVEVACDDQRLIEWMAGHGK